MRKAVAASLATVLSIGALSVPVVTHHASDPTPVDPIRRTIELTGISESALVAPEALDAVPVGLSDVGSVGPRTARGELAALTDPIETDEFLVTGLTWDAADTVDVTEVAARVLEAGQWSPWTELPVAESPDLEVANDAELMSDVRAGTEPLTTVGARGIQLRVYTATGSLPNASHIELIDPGSSPADELVTRGGSSAVAQASDQRDVLKPKVITREEWGANEKLGGPWDTLSNGVTSIYIHHTAGTNNYNANQGPALVRGIYSYHTQSMRWADIGYQFLVDKYGNVYQGRRTATVDTPIGAQTGGYNTGTIGVSALGNYETAQTTPALLEAITEVVAWKAYEYEIDPLGQTTLTTGSSSKSTTRARSGTKVKVNTIQGHRDTNYTACPGRNLYSKLPGIRRDAAERINQAAVDYGSFTDSLPAPKRIKPKKKKMPVQWKKTVKYSWKKVKDASAYQVLVQNSSNNRTGPPANTTWSLYTTVKKTSAKVTIANGSTRVIAVRAVDSAGRRGPIRVLTTSSRPVLKKLVSAPKKQWAVQKKKTFAGGQAHRSKSKGATMTVPGLSNIRFVTLRTVRGPKAGKVSVSIGGWSKTVNLKAKKNKPKAVVVVKLDKKRSGTLQIKTTTTKKVRISRVGVGYPKRKNPGVRALGPAASTPVIEATVTSAHAASRSVTWPAVAGADGYLVLSRTIDATAGSYSNWQRTTTSGLSATLSLQPGQTGEVAVLPVSGTAFRPAANPVSPARSLDLNSISLGAGWQLVQSSGVPPRVLTSDPASNAVATVAAVSKVRGLELGAVTGPDQGVLIIEAGGAEVARVDLGTYAAGNTTVIKVPFGASTGQALTLRSGTGQNVTISSLAYIRG
ncbi:Uncharacterized conserved protein, contains LGFP repeats [Micrococcales bacterium KH10]|nr:Uncharacterized conserved protein, contains LGFP repeats [Micrococcales bacterium KH10]